MMSMARPAAVAVLALVLSGCNSMQTGKQVVRTPTRCENQTVAIYFEQFSSDISKDGQAVIHAAADAAKPCKVTSVDVLGLADSVGGDSASNLELSKKRAKAVTQALAASALPDATFQVAAAGEAGAVTAKGQAAPMRRRVDIVLHLAPR
jgi:outer membrane protein OmpA-like peptidoglycan-associated protein